MKYKVVRDEPGKQSVAGSINDMMKLIDVPALRGSITHLQAVNAWTAAMHDDTAKNAGHFGETLETTAKRQIAFWLKMESVGASKEAALAAWLENFNKFLLMSLLMAFWEMDRKTAQCYAAQMDLSWLETPEGRIVASKYIFEVLETTRKGA
jgi:hypothetical protein